MKLKTIKVNKIDVLLGDILNNKLEIPVTYQGGKQRIAPEIWNIIENRNSLNGKEFYDLCCGSGAITIEAINRDLPFSNFNMIDYSVWGDFWESIGNGNFLIDIFKLYVEQIPKNKEDIQKFLQNLSKENPYDGVNLSHVYKYLLLQAGSFGGKQIWLDGCVWKNNSFRNYWMPTKTSNRKSPVNPMMPMPETLISRIEKLWLHLHGIVKGKNINIDTQTIFPDNSIIYIDPPYEKTTKYKHSFNIMNWIENVKRKSNSIIYVSEQKPLGKTSFLISENRKKGSISGGSNGINEWLTEF